MKIQWINETLTLPMVKKLAYVNTCPQMILNPLSKDNRLHNRTRSRLRYVIFMLIIITDFFKTIVGIFLEQFYHFMFTLFLHYMFMPTNGVTEPRVTLLGEIVV